LKILANGVYVDGRNLGIELHTEGVGWVIGSAPRAGSAQALDDRIEFGQPRELKRRADDLDRHDALGDHAQQIFGKPFDRVA
jgi:hypothetical protein